MLSNVDSTDNHSDSPTVKEEFKSSPCTHDDAPEPYSIYTRAEKWAIVVLIAFGGLFSPLASNIYFPVIPTLSQVFNKPIELINLTVTMFMVFQGLAPMLWGTLADSYGRRIMFICCLLLLSISCIGLALVPTNAYWLLLFLRCFQSTSSASTIALGAGVIGDISSPAERGGFFGVYIAGPLVGPAIGPVLGGVLAEHLGWRSIFWFLCIASAACALTLILFLPETLRSMAGNGSVLPPCISRPLIPLFGRKLRIVSTPLAPLPRKPFQNPLRLLCNPDISTLLAFNGLVCAVFFGVNASIVSVFHETYPKLNETGLGLCYIAIGVGMLIGSASSGKVLDWDYQRIKRGMVSESETVSESESEAESQQTKTTKEPQDDSFPIEKARMRFVPILLVCCVASTVAYGWCIERRVNLAAPLVFLFAVGLFTMAIMNTAQTLLLDLAPTQGASVTACNNLVRCGLGATMVAVIQLILTAIGPGWTYVLLAALCILASPLIYVVMRIGPGCRAKRRRAQETKAVAVVGVAA
ncbi:MFS general substrate transporter [Mycena galopus ATCC 62051]|nr:MFS general substrate transporter [Mycena galopus ATCC 62051]